MERGRLGIDKLLLEQGRRVVLVFTDGVDAPMNFSNRNKSLKDVMKRAEEEDVMVYAIGLAGRERRWPAAAARPGGGGRGGGRWRVRRAGGFGGGGSAAATAAADGEAR